jgi:hypothetical protein
LEIANAKEKGTVLVMDYGLVYEGALLSMMSHGKDGRSGHEEVTGNTPNISEWLDFEFYDIVWWWDRPNKPNVTDETKRLARWLGVSIMLVWTCVIGLLLTADR